MEGENRDLGDPAADRSRALLIVVFAHENHFAAMSKRSRARWEGEWWTHPLLAYAHLERSGHDSPRRDLYALSDQSLGHHDR
jgi:hypothetical protein